MSNALDDPHSETLHQAFVDQLKSKGILGAQGIEAAFRAVPRHLFLPDVEPEKVYFDDAIVTKYADGMVISSSSQPSLMAIMLEQLQLEPGHRVLEIGAGTGYNAALMAHIVGNSGQVITVDIDEDIVENARTHLAAAGFDVVQVICADGGLGYPAAAPFDRIILTVSAGDIAPAWWKQLKPGGRLLLPLSLRGMQVVVAFERAADHLVSSATTCGSFIGLRGAFAEPGYYVKLDPELGLLHLRLTEQRPVEANVIYQLLTGPSRDVTTQLQVTSQQIFDGLNLWLTLYEPQFCALVAHDTAVERGIMPSIFNIKTHTALGVLGETSLSVLLPSDPSRFGNIDAFAFELFVRSFGPDDTLTQRLIEQIRAWDAAGRPGEENLSIKVNPRDTNYTPVADEVVITNRWTKLAISWRL